MLRPPWFLFGYSADGTQRVMCEWATFREKFTWTPSRTDRKEEGRQEDRSRVRHEVKVRSWRGEDGTIYVQPIIETHDEEDPNDA